MKLKYGVSFNTCLTIIGLISFCISFYVFSPGFMSLDSLDQYEQALTHKYSDWHPIIMALVWSLLLKVYDGPHLMLALQLAMFFTAMTIIARTIKGRWGIVLIILMPSAPFIHNFLGYVIKDVQMATCGLLAFAILARAVLHERPLGVIEKTVSWVLITYCILIRLDSFLAFLPFIVFWAWSILRIKKPLSITLVTVMSLFCIGLISMTISSILKPEKTYPSRKLFIHDLAGIYKETGVNVFPSDIFEEVKGFDTNYLSKNYHTATYDMIWWNNDNVLMIPPPKAKFVNNLKEAWENAIKAYTGIYLHQRFEGFLYHLRIKKRSDDFFYYHPWVQDNEYGIALKHTRPHYLFIEWMEINKGMFYFLPWFWLLLNFLLIIPTFIIADKKLKYLTLVLLTSSLLYRLPQFFVFQTDTDFRYFYWTCISCTLSAYLILRGIRQGRS